MRISTIDAAIVVLLVVCQTASSGTIPWLETFDDDPIGDLPPVTQGETWGEGNDEDHYGNYYDGQKGLFLVGRHVRKLWVTGYEQRAMAYKSECVTHNP